MAAVCAGHYHPRCAALGDTSAVASNLRDSLVQSITGTLQKDVQDEALLGYGFLCPRAMAHLAHIKEMPQSSCHEGYYSTAQIVANLLHLVVQLAAFPKPNCTEEREVQCSTQQSDIMVQTDPGTDAEMQTDAGVDGETQTEMSDMLAARDMADAECQAAVPLAFNDKSAQSLALCRICHENLAEGEGLNAMACSQCQATYQVMCRRCNRSPVLYRGSICQGCHLGLCGELQEMKTDLISSQEAGLQLVSELEKKQNLIERGMKENKILGFWKKHKDAHGQEGAPNSTMQAVPERSESTMGSDGGGGDLEASESTLTDDEGQRRESLVQQRRMSRERLSLQPASARSSVSSMQMLSMPEPMSGDSYLDELSSVERFENSLEVAIAARVSALEASCKTCRLNKVAFKGLQCTQCQMKDQNFCGRCSNARVLSKGDTCSRCSSVVVEQQDPESKFDFTRLVNKGVTLCEAAVQSVQCVVDTDTIDVDVQAVLLCRVCQINSVLTVGTTCRDCDRMQNVVMKKRPPPREIVLRGSGVCARCAVTPVSHPGEVCERCVSKGPWRGVRIGGGYDVLKHPAPSDQVKETVRAESANRLDPTAFYGHGAPSLNSSPDRFRVGSYTHRSPRQTLTQPRSAASPFPGARRGNHPHVVVDAAALVRASLSAMTHTLTGGTPAAGAPQGEGGEPNLYRVMVPSNETRPLSAPGTARATSFS